MNKSMREMSYAIITTVFFVICASIMLVGIFCVKVESIHIADAIIAFVEVAAIAFFASAIYLYRKFAMLISIIVMIVCEFLKILVEMFKEDGATKFFLYYIPRIKTFSFILILFLLFIYFKQDIVLTKKLHILFYLPAIDSLFFMSMIIILSKKASSYEFCDILRIMYCIMETFAMFFLAKWFIFASQLDDIEDTDIQDEYEDNNKKYINSTYSKDRVLKNYEFIESMIEDIVRNYDENKRKKDKSTNDKVLNLKKAYELDEDGNYQDVYDNTNSEQSPSNNPIKDEDKKEKIANESFYSKKNTNNIATDNSINDIEDTEYEKDEEYEKSEEEIRQLENAKKRIKTESIVQKQVKQKKVQTKRLNLKKEDLRQTNDEQVEIVDNIISKAKEQLEKEKTRKDKIFKENTDRENTDKQTEKIKEQSIDLKKKDEADKEETQDKENKETSKMLNLKKEETNKSLDLKKEETSKSLDLKKKEKRTEEKSKSLDLKKEETNKSLDLKKEEEKVNTKSLDLEKKADENKEETQDEDKKETSKLLDLEKKEEKTEEKEESKSLDLKKKDGKTEEKEESKETKETQDKEEKEPNKSLDLKKKEEKNEEETQDKKDNKEKTEEKIESSSLDLEKKAEDNKEETQDKDKKSLDLKKKDKKTQNKKRKK